MAQCYGVMMYVARSPVLTVYLLHRAENVVFGGCVGYKANNIAQRQTQPYNVRILSLPEWRKYVYSSHGYASHSKLNSVYDRGSAWRYSSLIMLGQGLQEKKTRPSYVSISYLLNSSKCV